MAKILARSAAEGLWESNPALRQLLGLCPLLAVSGTATHALGLGLATVLVLTLTNTLVAASRGWIPSELRLPAYVLLIASAVTAVELLIRAFLPELDRVLGLFLPLIITNCIVLGRAEAYASRHPVGAAALDGLFMGLGFAAALLALAGLRELLAHGTLFRDAAELLGAWAAWLELGPLPGYRGFLPAMLPVGAFFLLALLLALRQTLARQGRARAATVP
ncbi:MAG: electron transport complex subunit RsxE [Xanthomonadales bacterium]|nr:electron transport complex subunit RsxE [Xanthomonadales bacterium]